MRLLWSANWTMGLPPTTHFCGRPRPECALSRFVVPLLPGPQQEVISPWRACPSSPQRTNNAAALPATACSPCGRSDQPCDRVAEFGLGTLIVGGAAAALVKTGFWKTILVALAAGWKLVLGVVVAAGAAFTKLFKRNKDA